MADVNPWRIIGWIVLGFLLLLMYSCYQAFKPKTYAEQAREDAQRLENRVQAAAAQPRGELTITDFTCEAGRGEYTTMTVRATNTGPVAIPFAKLYARIGNAPEEAYFMPTEVQVGSIVSATLMRREGGDCKIVGAQDRSGRAIDMKTATPG